VVGSQNLVRFAGCLANRHSIHPIPLFRQRRPPAISTPCWGIHCCTRPPPRLRCLSQAGCSPPWSSIIMGCSGSSSVRGPPVFGGPVRLAGSRLADLILTQSPGRNRTRQSGLRAGTTANSPNPFQTPFKKSAIGCVNDARSDDPETESAEDSRISKRSKRRIG